MSGHIHSYGKIYNLGHAALENLLDGPVVIEEKVDGSQFSFGVFDGELRCRSNGADLNVDAPEKMFQAAIDSVRHRAHLLENGCTYRGEYLQKPKHNTLCYNRVPTGNIIIFDIDCGQQSYMTPHAKADAANSIGLEVVPQVTVEELTLDGFRAAIERESCLGGQQVEGVVIKNYARFGKDGKVLMGKYVSEKFKEVHKGDWRERNPTASDIKLLIGQSLRTPARWNKAIQHLRERGLIADDPKDIGLLFKEINSDVLAECGDEIRDQLFKWAWPHISRELTRGMPQWYKDQLAEKQFAQEAVTA